MYMYMYTVDCTLLIHVHVHVHVQRAQHSIKLRENFIKSGLFQDVLGVGLWWGGGGNALQQIHVHVPRVK